MKISFQKKAGDPSRGIAFFWKLKIESTSQSPITDHFIPELFFDYFFLKEGKVQCIDPTTGEKISLRQQTLKTLHNRPLRFVFSTPLVLYGAQLSLAFAESFWEDAPANSLLAEVWVKENVNSLEGFASQVSNTLSTHRVSKHPRPLFSTSLQEGDWLAQYSPRHKRRMYTSTFGLSRKELLNIHNVQSFLEQTCDFASRNPRIIEHVNPDAFYDQPHLNRLFKKMTGFSPVEYFEASSILQDNLMSASYNANPGT